MSKQKSTSLLGLLKDPSLSLLALGLAFLIFDIQYWIMTTLPGNRDEMCVIGGGFTLTGVLFAILLSAMAGLAFIGLYCTFRQKHRSYRSLSVSSIGSFSGTLSVFCPICAFPVVSALAISINLSNPSSLTYWLRIISILFLSYALYDLNRQLKGTCRRCVS